MMTGSVGYQDLVQAAIERESDVLGLEEAVGRANAVDGLSVNDDGEVLALSGEGQVVLGALVDAYVDASGDVAAFLIARKLENMPHDALELPENLDRHM